MSFQIVNFRERFLAMTGYFCAAFSVLGAIAAFFMTFVFTSVLGMSWAEHSHQSQEHLWKFAGVVLATWGAVAGCGFAARGLIFHRWFCERASASSSGLSGSIVTLKVFLASCVLLLLLVGWLVFFVNKNAHLADGVVIPPGMNVQRVTEYYRSTWGRQTDDEASVLWAVPSHEELSGRKIFNVDLPSFEGAQRELLLRHLATSCKWRLTEYDGKVFAVRREVRTEGNWSSGRSGCITGHPFAVRCRTVLGLDGPVFADDFQSQNCNAVKGELDVRLDDSNTSYFCDRFGRQNLEVFEDSTSKARVFTNRQLVLLKDELDKLNSSKVAATKSFDLSLMPSLSKGPREPELRVVALSGVNSGGTYQVDAFANPGEPGKTYLKVFEATRDIRLSEANVWRDSLEYIGWSTDKDENFFYESTLEIDEGGLKDYPARFELWFRPSDRSKPERKLSERIYYVHAGFRCLFHGGG